MFCPCSAGRTTRSFHHPDQSGNVDCDGRPPPHEPFGIHRVSEPCKLRIPSDLLGAPFPVTVNVPAEFIRHSSPDWIYNTRVQWHTIRDYLSLNQMCTAYAERLLLGNDNKLSQLYCAEEVLRAPRLPDSY